MTSGETVVVRKRAKPLTAADRRAAIIYATIPLIREYGYGLTTRQIAQAAGVAEGTLFRAFADKKEIMQAAVDQAFDTGPFYETVAGIDPTLPLEERLAIAVRVIFDAIGDFRALVMVLHASAESDTAMSWHGPGRKGGKGHGGPRRFVAAITQLLEPDQDRLGQPPEIIAAMVVGAVMGTLAPGVHELEDKLTPERICDVILNGCLRHR